ncbi:MAG: family 10 glycosylhydrolase, partial [Planctomycetota bacterium]
MRSSLLQCSLLLAAALCVSHTFAASPEVRGTWLTTTGAENHIRTGAKTAAVMADLRDIGLNTVYVETWKNGYTNFPSPTLQSVTGSVDRAPYLGSSRDLVQETLIEAHRNELNYIGWFEYGFAAEFIGSGGNTSTPFGRAVRDNGWLLRDQNGQLANGSNGFAWMNPAVPEVREFLIDITLETVERYDLDGIQFDDRLSWPREFGWDATTAAIYQQETGRSLPSSVNDTLFREWRQDKVTLFAEELTAAVEAVRPDLLLSVSPSITNFSDINFNAEWPEWQDAGLFDE